MKTCGKPRGLARFLIHRTLTIEKVVIVQTIGDNSAYFMQEFKLYLEKSEAKSTDSFINFLLFLNFLSPSHSN